MISVDKKLIPFKTYFQRQYNLSKLLNDIGNPQNKFEVVNIVGTNGKGSTAKFIYDNLVGKIANIGLFTSPAFLFHNERIKVNENFITDKQLKAIIKKYKKTFANYKLTFFEIWTFVAIIYFTHMNVEFAIIEAGIGGILDSTNVFQNQKAVCITTIDLDHTEVLGSKVENIIEQKIGIVKPNAKVFISNDNLKYKDIISMYCKNDIDYCKIFQGEQTYQKYNKGLAKELVEYLGYSFTSYLEPPLGRLTILNKNPLLLIDGCHNISGARELSKECKKIPNLTILFAAIKGKEQNEMIEVLEKSCDKLFVTTFKHFKSWDINKVDHPNRVKNWKKFLRKNKDKSILICGSLYFIPLIYKWFLRRK